MVRRYEDGPHTRNPSGNSVGGPLTSSMLDPASRLDASPVRFHIGYHSFASEMAWGVIAGRAAVLLKSASTVHDSDLPACNVQRRLRSLVHSMGSSLAYTLKWHVDLPNFSTGSYTGF